MMSKFLKKYYWIFIALTIILIDQITKYIIVSKIDYKEEITVISDFFSFKHEHNDGIAFGMLANFGVASKIIVAVLTLIMIVAAIFMILKGWVSKPLSVVSVAFIIGGGIGNLIDRIFLQYVVDFFAFTFWGNDFAIFNVADVFVTVGTLLFICCFLFIEKDILTAKEVNNGNQEL